MAITAALIGALGAAGGGALSYFGSKPKKGKKFNKNNPLYQAQLLEALIGLGVPVTDNQILGGSPLAQMGFSKRRFDELSTLIQQGLDAGLSDSEIAKQLAAVDQRKNGTNFLINKKGETRGRVKYDTLESFIADQRAFMESAFADRDAIRSLQDETLAGRRSAQSAISQILGDFVAPTGDEISARSAEIEDILRAQIERDFGERREQSLYEANAYGVNPAGRLARLDEGQALANLATGPDALARTLQLISGEQGVQTTALGALKAALGAGTNNASNLLGFQLNASNAAAQQALALALLNSQRAANLGGAVTDAANQLALIPALRSEQSRRQQLDDLINRQYGITTGTP